MYRLFLFWLLSRACLFVARTNYDYCRHWALRTISGGILCELAFSVPKFTLQVEVPGYQRTSKVRTFKGNLLFLRLSVIIYPSLSAVPFFSLIDYSAI